MRIAQIAPLYESVPPRLYGGTERVVSYLTERLVALGHTATLFASGDSRTRARLVPGCARSLRLNGGVGDPLTYHVAQLRRVFDLLEEFDVVHNHMDYLGFPLAVMSSRPVVTTMHGRLDLPEMMPLLRTFPELELISISDAQRAPVPGIRFRATVAHGLPPDLLVPGPGGDALVFLGRMSPEKRPEVAIRVATQAGVPIRLAAKVADVDRGYFAREVRPLLDHPLVEWLGEVDDAGKQELLGNARALLMPIDWPEPFGLVMIEALACGTPVIARRLGSAPEVIEHGVTGFLCDDADAMLDAIRRVDEIDRAVCRSEFERRFTDEQMARAYLRVYDEILAGGQRGAA